MYRPSRMAAREKRRGVQYDYAIAKRTIATPRRETRPLLEKHRVFSLRHPTSADCARSSAPTPPRRNIHPPWDRVRFFFDFPSNKSAAHASYHIEGRHKRPNGKGGIPAICRIGQPT